MVVFKPVDEAAEAAQDMKRVEQEAKPFEEWAILELMGHRTMHGKVTEVTVFGAKMLRIDVPSTPPLTQFYGFSAIYCVTPTTEQVVRKHFEQQLDLRLRYYGGDDQDDEADGAEFR